MRYYIEWDVQLNELLIGNIKKRMVEGKKKKKLVQEGG